jgi:hypothetical protein
VSKKPLDGLKLMIGTPCGTGRIDIGYASSLIETIEMCQQFGVKPDWARIPGCSDLPATRAKILGHFYRSDFDFLLMIDDDMVWDAPDVMKMLDLQKDFLAAAGMRKIIGPSEFAFNNCQANGETLPILYDGEGLLHCTEIGMAFVMVSRNFATKMIEHYRSELEFEIVSPEGNTTEVDVFCPFIMPGTKRRLPEDYAVCVRWRRLGGDILVMPDCVLGHVGSFTWRGAVADTMRQIGKIEDGETIMFDENASQKIQ